MPLRLKGQSDAQIGGPLCEQAERDRANHKDSGFVRLMQVYGKI